MTADASVPSRLPRAAHRAAFALAVVHLAVALAACAANGSSASGAGSPAAGEAPPPDDEAPMEAPAAGDTIHDVAGHVVHVRADWYALQPDDDPGSRYAPDALPEEFREDGLAVVFSGRVGEIPPDVRMWGTPLELTDIRRRDDG